MEQVLALKFRAQTFVTTLRPCVLVVIDTVDGKDNQEEETMEVNDIRMYNFS